MIQHPEGRVVAIQQQMFFAQLLAEKMDLDTEVILRKLSLAGLSLTLDVNEIAVDAATILPNLQREKAAKLRAVPDLGGEQ